MEQQDELNVELKSEPMNEMLSEPPKWIVRSGSGVFLLVLFLVLCLAWFIRYPDEVQGTVMVSTSNPPIEFSNQTYVQLKGILVKDKQSITKGQLLAQFDNQAKTIDIEKSKTYLDYLHGKGNPLPDQLKTPPANLQLGSFQEQWTNLIAKVENWNMEHRTSILPEQLASIKREIAFRENLNEITRKKISISEEEYALITEELKSSNRLAEQGAISKQTYNQDKRTYNQSFTNLQSQKEQFVQNQITLNDLRQKLLQEQHDGAIAEQQRQTEIVLAASTLENSFYEWGKNAVWIAPCSGQVLFNTHLQKNRYYKADEAGLVIVPSGTGFMALATVKAEGAGKIKTGQRVFIELTDYPATEFGKLEGKVQHITPIDKAGEYQVKITLKDGLTTSYGKKIPPKAKLNGQAKIITKDKRLLVRFFEQFEALIQ